MRLKRVKETSTIACCAPSGGSGIRCSVSYAYTALLHSDQVLREEGCTEAIKLQVARDRQRRTTPGFRAGGADLACMVFSFLSSFAVRLGGVATSCFRAFFITIPASNTGIQAFRLKSQTEIGH